MEPITLELNDRLSVRLYEDCRPHCLETGLLQKGLVLMHDGKELVEEGLGFGVPVVKYEDKTYFATTAEVEGEKNPTSYLLKKTYVMDTISKKTWQGNYINDNLYSTWRKRFAKLYLGHKELSPLFNRIMEWRELVRINTEFVKSKSRGLVEVEYSIENKMISVHVDFSNLSLNGCKELLVLNEQGSTVFDTYCDASGISLVGAKIGGWHQVSVNCASFQSRDGQFAFRLNKVPEAMLFRGWERTKNRFSWAGLSYSLAPHHRIFNYEIVVKS